MARRRGRLGGDGRDDPQRENYWRQDYWRERFPPPSRPIEVQGGIRAQTKRGQFAKSWWAARWIAVLESFQIGGRLARAQSYARRGQVMSIDVAKGWVRARVQGSRPEPYEVTVKVHPLESEAWARVARQLATEAGFAARLLAGEMPREIEQAFGRAGASLFPEQSRELATACSCPDWSNPCKHVAAVYYLLGEEFDRDPFLLFTLRGRTRDELLAELARADLDEPARADRDEPARAGEARRPSSTARTTRERRGRTRARDELSAGDASQETSATSRGRRGRSGPREEEKASAAPAPLSRGEALNPDRFWRAAPPSTDPVSAAEPPSAHAELVRRLGRFPFWRGERPPLEVLESLYANASRRALEILTESAAGADADDR